ncbi:MAG TPA: hypothetical protein VGI34_07870, partial [Candidatus Acidoferrales bacterium]
VASKTTTGDSCSTWLRKWQLAKFSEMSSRLSIFTSSCEAEERSLLLGPQGPGVAVVGAFTPKVISPGSKLS